MTTPYGKYPETVNYTLGKTVTNFDVLDGTKYEGDDDENNAWTRYLKEKLNVQNTNLFEANDGDDYAQKAVSYTHLDVYKRQAAGLKKTMAPRREDTIRTEDLPWACLLYTARCV